MSHTTSFSDTDPRRLMSTQEVSAYLRLSVSTLNKWRLTGDGPTFIKLGARVAYRPSDVEAFAESRVRRSTSDRAA